MATIRSVSWVMIGIVLAAVTGLTPPTAAAASPDSALLVHQTRRQVDDAGQYYLAWWIAPALFQTLVQESGGQSAAQAQQLSQALEGYLVFALTRGQEGAKQLEDTRDRADLVGHSSVSLNGQVLSGSPAVPDAAAAAALAAIRPILEQLLGRDGHGVEFVLYPYAPGQPVLDPTGYGTLEYSLYRKHFAWRMPLWGAATASTSQPAAPVPPAAPQVAAALPAAAAVAMAPAAPKAPLPMQRRKVDPTSGEEFPERYNYNPYTGQKLVSQ